MARDLGHMRLICPNCGAQYEVPAEVVPEAGRDVQCSNCGHTWFQHHPDHAPAELAEPVPEDVPEDEDIDWEMDGPEEPPTEAVAPPAAEVTEDADEAPADPAPTAAEAAPRRGLDPSVAEVLREEAEREAQARRSASGSLESQPDLGLDSSAESDEERRARQARERMAKIRGAEPPAEAPVAESAPEPTAQSRAQTAAASRGDMLPDIDEINQTLRATSERRPVETPQGRAPDDEDAGGGFARGLSLTVLAASLLLALYVFAAPLAELAPSLAPLLDAYVAQANDLRVWLQATLAGLLGDAGAASGA